MKPERPRPLARSVLLSGPQAASMTLVRATSRGSWPAQPLRSSPWLGPAQALLAGLHSDAITTAASIPAPTSKESFVNPMPNSASPPSNPPEFPEFTRQNKRNPQPTKMPKLYA